MGYNKECIKEIFREIDMGISKTNREYEFPEEREFLNPELLKYSDDEILYNFLYCEKQSYFIDVRKYISDFFGTVYGLTEEAYDILNGANKNTYQNPIFNITNPQNSIIGTQNNAAININNYYNYEIFKSEIEEKSEETDKTVLHELNDELKDITENNNPIEKGRFAKFVNVIIKYKWVADLVAKIFGTFILKT